MTSAIPIVSIRIKKQRKWDDITTHKKNETQNSSLTHFTLHTSHFTLLVLLFILTTSSISPAVIGGGSANVGKILIPMDVPQTDHLKAYGIAYWALQQGHPVEWLLNYRGDSFLIDNHETIAREARIRAVSFQAISAAPLKEIGRAGCGELVCGRA